MAFIRVQNAKLDDDGNIVGGSASIVESVYVKEGTVHCKQVMKEGLGTIVFLNKERNEGVFLSKTRGLVRYNLAEDEFEPVEEDDPRVNGAVPEPPVHTRFGDSHALLMLMKSQNILRMFRNMAAGDDILYEKMLAHTVHGVLRNGSKITCDRFIEQSFLSNVLDVPMSVLRTDSRYFEAMGSYEMKVAFFREFVKEMRLRHPGFGKCCYMDSTPLPNEIKKLPLTRYSSHGTGACSMQARMVLILDNSTNLPVWFELIPGNVLDVSTVTPVKERAERELGIKVTQLVLDAGYISEEMLKTYRIGGDEKFVAKMPDRKGYPFESLFASTHNLFGSVKHAFVRNGHTYFGALKQVSLFGMKFYAYVYVDHENASDCFQTFMEKESERFDKMCLDDRNWARYGGGYFVLVSNMKTSPEEMLGTYIDRTHIEGSFKTGKEYLGMLPIRKRNESTVYGKMLQDMMELVVYLILRRKADPETRSVTDLVCDLQSVTSYRDGADTLTVSVVNKQAREAYEKMGSSAPPRLSIKEFRSDIYL